MEPYGWLIPLEEDEERVSGKYCNVYGSVETVAVRICATDVFDNILNETFVVLGEISLRVVSN